LGSELSLDGEPDFDKKINRFQRICGTIRKLLKKTRTDNQMKFYKVVVRPTQLYGSETWVTAKRDMTRLEAAEMRFLRSVKIRQNKKRSHEKELEISGIQDVRSKCKQNSTYHLERMDNTRLPTYALNYNLEEEEIVDALGNDGNTSMLEQVKRPNPWRKMMIMICSEVTHSPCVFGFSKCLLKSSHT
jgi:hypothetical protein